MKLSRGFVKHVGIILLVLFSSSCSSLKKRKKQKEKLNAEQQVLLQKYSAHVQSDIASQHLALYQFIDAWWGVPHKIGGTEKTGVDCSGFVVRLFDDVYHKQVPRTTDDLFSTAVPIDTAQLNTGDLVFIVFQGRKKVSHVGVYLQEGRFVHASTSKGVRIDYMRDSYYKKQQFSGGRIP